MERGEGVSGRRAWIPRHLSKESETRFHIPEVRMATLFYTKAALSVQLLHIHNILLSRLLIQKLKKKRPNPCTRDPSYPKM